MLTEPDLAVSNDLEAETFNFLQERVMNHYVLSDKKKLSNTAQI